MGFEIFGMKVFDLREPYGYIEIFSAIFIVLLLACIGFCILKLKSRK